jgi:isoaspartyl peptidase/L-asparaginase-like protein (Ntn-hydrolase superfamily)
MKIDHDLRQAIKAAHDVQEHRDGHLLRTEAADKFLKSHPAAAKNLARLRKKRDEAARAHSEAAKPFNEFMKSLGLDDRQEGYMVGYSDDDKDRFVAAGGKFDVTPRWSYNSVMAKLAAADPKDGAKILADHGINWK